MRARKAAVLLAASMACGVASAALAPDELFKRVAPSVWRVLASSADGRALASGSGVVIAPETLVTNCHVLRGAAAVSIRQQSVTMPARLLHADAERDLCELKVAGLRAPAVAVAPEPARVGQRIYTLGTPRGLESTLSDGLVSGIRPDAPGGGAIQISAPISPGSSGGGLFDEDGRLLGITTSVIAGMAQNLNFAKPATLLADIPARSAAALQRWREARASGGSPAGPAAGIRSAAPGTPRTVTITVMPGPSRSAPVIAAAPSASPEAVPGAQPRHIASGYAAIDDIDAIPFLDDRGRERYRDWLNRPTPRAFALAPNGRWAATSGVRPADPHSPVDPVDRALAGCERVAKMPCRLYAVNRAVVWVRQASPSRADLPGAAPAATASPAPAHP